MGMLWFVIGAALFLIGIALLFVCRNKERQGKDPGFKFILAMAFLIVGAAIMTISFSGAKRLVPPERQPYQEIKSVSITPPLLGGFFCLDKL